MKRVIFVNLVLLGVLVLGDFGSSLRADEYDFKKTKWGMTREQVLATENSKPFSQSEEQIWYYSQLWNKKVGVVYEFMENKLVAAGYVLNEEHSNLNDFIKDYEDFKKALTNEYGWPVVDDVKWENEVYKSQPDFWGLAVSMGHLKYTSQWDAGATNITSVLVGENFKMSCAITYDAKKYVDLVKKLREEKALGRFK